MRVFVTGATGFVGSPVVQDLLAHGHEVVGLARSDKSAAALERGGVGVVRGTTEDLDVLKTAAADTDGVIHTAYIHDFSPTANPMRFAEIDRDAIAAFGEALAGTGKPLVVAAGLPAVAPGVTATEDDKAPDNPPYPRFTEQAAIALVGKGVRVSVVRMAPSVHGEGDLNFVLMLTRLALAKGVSAYVGEGANLVGGASAGRGPAVPPGAGAGARRDAAERGRGRGRAVQGRRRRHRPQPEPAGQVGQR